MRALVIEDYVVLAMQIADELTDLGFDEVSCATTYSDAIQMAAQNCPHLITADHRLGGLSGIEAVSTICAEVHIPVVYIVGVPDEICEQVPDAIILEKPFSSAALGDAVRMAMKNSLPDYLSL